MCPVIMLFPVLGFFLLLLDPVIARCTYSIVIDHEIALPYRATFFTVLIASTSLDLSIAVVEKKITYKFSAFLHFEDFSYVYLPY